MRLYISELEDKIGPSGLQQHISIIEATVHCLTVIKEATAEEATFNTSAESSFRKLSDFPASFCGEKARQERAKLEHLPENLLATDYVCNFLQSSLVSKVFEQCCSTLQKNQMLLTMTKPSPFLLDVCTRGELSVCFVNGFIIPCNNCRNVQQPEAITNMTEKI